MMGCVMKFFADDLQEGINLLFRICRDRVGKESRRQKAHFGVPGTG
jgi:hypothetical protein